MPYWIIGTNGDTKATLGAFSNSDSSPSNIFGILPGCSARFECGCPLGHTSASFRCQHQSALSLRADPRVAIQKSNIVLGYDNVWSRH
ncbi:hypothetical protein PAPYR_9432 [Paratrimastix pyriformis]|uniref:Uncharacterized protein n=1 Tax=Paratrimastix pyriformis TaxID=342808 RepID=A0ABQ8UC06_9EUKA|nr:hypothetical protein PAPYR_9432 [Paratrimastix pyriformis]